MGRVLRTLTFSDPSYVVDLRPSRMSERKIFADLTVLSMYARPRQRFSAVRRPLFNMR